MWIRVAFVLVALGVLSGCSLIGLGIGAAMPKTEVVEERPIRAARGEDVRLQMKSGDSIAGVVEDNDRTNVRIKNADGMHSFPIEYIRVVQKHVKTTSALDGFAFGFGLDAAALFIGLIAYGVSRLDFSNACIGPCHY